MSDSADLDTPHRQTSPKAEIGPEGPPDPHPHVPGGCLPSLGVIGHCAARRTGMRAVELTDLTFHYAETLRRWRANVEAATTLAYCEAGCTERRIRSVQMLLAKLGWRRSAGLTGAYEPPRVLAS
jgi:hypothetical protein